VTESLKGISVGLVGDAVLVRVVGRGTFQNGQPLRRYALEMLERGVQNFIVDLGGCDGMDSTFLGVLAGIGLRLAQDGRAGKIRIANVGPRNAELLQTLGLDRLFGMDQTEGKNLRYEPPVGVTLQRLPDSDVAALSKPLNKVETADLMLEAHDNLVRANQSNAPRFRDLTKFLRESVEKGKAKE